MSLNSTPGIWTAAHVAAIADTAPSYTPLITAADSIIPDLDIWDMWPLTTRAGATVDIAGGILWFALSAPPLPNPEDRHGLARIRLLHQQGEKWTDLGNALPDGFSPGSREWSGSAILDAPHFVTLFFTAAGRRGERQLTFEQRLFQTTGTLNAAQTAITAWSPPVESVASDDDIYVLANQAEGAPGKIKAFRDPGYFQDPADGRCYLLFAASLKRSGNAANGAIGIARAAGPQRWQLLPPLLHADGVTNELERPHIVVRDGHYYLFWSTLHAVFADHGPAGPTGLYGMVAPALFGPYTPLNGTGLVAANPPAEPEQTYSWLVLGDLRVASFVDDWAGSAPDLQRPRRQFGGVPAPFFSLDVAAGKAWIRQTS
jgi:levansucrase